ncbi:tyrosine-type recombinase/integrase [uncultured Flavonifractor sp.]|uniref:tyrosine-type recombinase/integrase n=1 Tax=uncultured Flavonifractor sp. TaxID=1193534 RepID=UPI0026311999|nr:site-specific integrase [uncultured Flavonifractor sp.]
MSRKAASGAGTIRKKTVTRSGKEYTYWEARFTVGRDPGTGKQIQRSITGKTQKEVAQRLKAATLAVDQGTYTTPTKMTVGVWLDTWTAEYLGGVKPATVQVYKNNVRLHIKPALGAVGLSELRPHMVQRFINGLELSPASVRLAYKVLHQALQKAVKLDYIPRNPASDCQLPRMEQKEICPLDDEQAAALLLAVKGGRLELLISVALFTGCRLSELLGLTWDCVDFQKGTILICKQLTRPEHRAESGLFISPKNGKSRTITPAPFVLKNLKEQRRRQAEMQIKAGPLWDNPHNLAFTDQIGGPLLQQTVEGWFSAAIKAAGLDSVRFHDLRHTYAVNAIRAGDDIKTIQGNLGHSSAGFTLDRYGHFTERMKQDSAARMEGFIKAVFSS